MTSSKGRAPKAGFTLKEIATAISVSGFIYIGIDDERRPSNERTQT